jgi:uncharacterized membrane protein YsdA (DUF1294 family)
MASAISVDAWTWVLFARGHSRAGKSQVRRPEPDLLYGKLCGRYGNYVTFRHRALKVSKQSAASLLCAFVKSKSFI